jgi:hypothetical protein
VATVDTVVLEAVDCAVDGLLNLPEANERLTDDRPKVESAGGDIEHLDALRAAVCFGYTPDGFRGDFVGSGETDWPRTVEGLPASVLEVWQAYADRVRSHWLQAHLHDLLKEAGAQPAHLHARAAIAAYRATVPDFMASSDHRRGRFRAVRALTRALDLAWKMNQRDLRTTVTRDIVDLAKELLGADEVLFGLVYELVEALDARHSEDEVVGELLEQALSVCSEPIMQSRFLHRLRKLESDPEAHRAVDERLVNVMISAADRQPGATAHAWLEDAARLAGNSGLTDLHDKIIVRLQSMHLDEFGLMSTRIPIPEPTEAEIDGVREVIDQAVHLKEALCELVWSCPPAGTIKEADEIARATVAQAPLDTTFPRNMLNSAGPVSVAGANSDAMDRARAMAQRLALYSNGLLAVAQLDRIAERFAPSEDDLVGALAHPLPGSPSKTLMLAHAFQQFWSGHDDAAVHLALPRVESLLREIERARGIPIVSVAKGTTPGGVSVLGSLINSMHTAGFDPDWTRSISLLIHDGEHGLNLRNDIGHGLADCPSRRLVALVLQAALFLLSVADGSITLAEPTTEHNDDRNPEGQ